MIDDQAPETEPDTPSPITDHRQPTKINPLRRPSSTGPVNGHSDRGSNYTSKEFADTLAALDLRQSVGRTGICYDNAMAESFFGALKNEFVHRTVYPTREHARRDTKQLSGKRVAHQGPPTSVALPARPLLPATHDHM